MAWYSFIDGDTSLVFSPKVTPDPADAKRLAETFQHALKQAHQQKLQARTRVITSARSAADNGK